MTIPNFSNKSEQSLYESLVQATSTGFQEQVKKSTPLDVVTWISRNYYIPETNFLTGERGPRPIDLVQYHKDVLTEINKKDENGLYEYVTVVWSDIKKSAKSSIVAAYALYIADYAPWGEIYLIANDLKQADSRVAKYARRAVSDSPYLQPKYHRRGYSLINSLNNAMIEALPIDPEGEAGSNADLITYSELWGAADDAKSRMWCFDEKTEILTRRGWLRFDEMTLDDEVATVVPETHELEWHRPRAINRTHYKGVMHYYGSKNKNRLRFSKLVTPQHRLYGTFSYNSKGNKYAKHGIMTSEELRESGYRVYFPLTAVSDYPQHDRKQITFGKTKFKPEFSLDWLDFCRFMGIYLSDGHTRTHWQTGQPVSVCVTQSWKVNPEKHAKIRELFTRMFGDGYKEQEYSGDRVGSTDFKVHSTTMAEYFYKLGDSKTKYIPQEIKDSNPECLREFLMWYILGDGSVVSNSSWAIVTGSSQIVDDMQEIALKLGYYCTASQNATGNNWRIRVSVKDDLYYRELDSRYSWGEEDYDGIVWCPSVPNGLVVARRDHKPFVSGNTEMTLSPTKFRQSQRVVESYAGYKDTSETLYNLWETGVKNGELLWPDKYYPVMNGDPQPLELYVNREARMICLWNTMPRCPWQTADYYKQEATILMPDEFSRMHRNQWITTTETFIPIEWWDACARESIPEIPPNHPCIVSMDAAVSDDTFGILMACRHPDRVNHPDDIVILYSRKWSPPIGGKIDFVGTLEEPGPELELRRLIDNYNVIEVAYDEHQLHDMASRLYREGIAFFRKFPQGSGKHSRLVADSALRDRIRDRRFWYVKGDHADLRDHIQNSDAKVDNEDRQIRIVKRTQKLKIDLCVTLSQASYELTRLNA